MLEDESFWFRHRNNCIVAAVGQYPPAGCILDVGGGNGYVARRMIDEGFRAAVLEPGEEGALNAKLRRRVPEVFCVSLKDSGLPGNSMAAIGLFDVLEHIEDDRRFLKRVWRVLKPGGMLYMTVPLHSWLWSLSDIVAGHYRRYSHRRIVELIGAQFELLLCTSIFGALVLPVLALRVGPFRLGLARERNVLSAASEHGVSGGLMAKLLDRFLRREVDDAALARRRRLGTSCLLVARKRAI